MTSAVRPLLPVLVLLALLLQLGCEKTEDNSLDSSQPAKNRPATQEAETQPTTHPSENDLLRELANTRKQAFGSIQIPHLYLSSSIDSQLKKAMALSAQRESLNSNWLSLVGDSDHARNSRVRLITEYFTARIEWMKDLREDIVFVVSKLEQSILRVNRLCAHTKHLRGKISRNCDIAIEDYPQEKAEFLAASQRIAGQIVPLCLEDKPEPGTTRHREWRRERRKIEINWDRLLTRIRVVRRRVRILTLCRSECLRVETLMNYGLSSIVESTIGLVVLKYEISSDIELIRDWVLVVNSTAEPTMHSIGKLLGEGIAEKLRQLKSQIGPLLEDTIIQVPPIQCPPPALLTFEELAAGNGTKRIRKLLDECDKAIAALKKDLKKVVSVR